MMLSELISGLGVTRRDASSVDVRICDLTEDSRTAMPGSLFIARAGAKTDGRRYIGRAIDAGAVAVLTDPGCAPPEGLEGVAWLTAPDVPAVIAPMAERFFGRPSSRLTMIGVTGTNGKTTIATLIHQIFNAARRSCGLIGTVQIDDGKGVSSAGMTTPPAIELSLALSNMVEAGYTAAAMEVSSHSLDQGRVAAIRFDAAVFTNITGDHLDYHQTLDRYLAAKKRLFDGLDERAVAVVNTDDPSAPAVIADCRAHIIRCSASPDRGADCTVASGPGTPEGTPMRLTGAWGTIEATVLLIGDYNAMNVLQSVACAHALGVPASRIASALPKLRPPSGRLERVTPLTGTAPFLVFVDYAHTDDALAHALGAVRPLVREGSALRLVFGCGGDRDATKRPRMGRVACRMADVVYVTSDNPRTEAPNAIIRQILDGVDDQTCFHVKADPDRRRAIRKAIEEAAPGDVVLIAGKGHEDYQILPDGSGGVRTIHFDDREETREALEARGPFEPITGARTHERSPAA